MTFDYDKQADALDITLSAGVVMRTVQIDPGTLIDLDAGGNVLSIELIHPARGWPLEELVAAYPLDPDDVTMLRSLWTKGEPFPFESAERVLQPA
jgi:uncharacterized protein YuzE